MTERYHFPCNYLWVARELESDWIVYRETRVSGGRMAYIAAAFVERIDADPSDPSHFYARVRDYLEFDQPVPSRDGSGRFAERFLREMPRPGDAGRSLRGKSDRKSTRLNSSHSCANRMPSYACTKKKTKHIQ